MSTPVRKMLCAAFITVLFSSVQCKFSSCGRVCFLSPCTYSTFCTGRARLTYHHFCFQVKTVRSKKYPMALLTDWSCWHALHRIWPKTQSFAATTHTIMLNAARPLTVYWTCKLFVQRPLRNPKLKPEFAWRQYILDFLFIILLMVFIYIVLRVQMHTPSLLIIMILIVGLLLACCVICICIPCYCMMRRHRPAYSMYYNDSS